AQRFKDRLTSKSSSTESDPELNGGASASAGKVPAPAKPQGDAALSDADLWEKKRAEGMTPAAATAHVRSRKK
ncbi:MAG: hypothetical protein M3P26_10570, partial [Gemmatimonadota bacterium]|nr:hypothetical protein [Gemmatimonadota bacterium]